jgi:outer membrane protein assembly factor BamA
MRFGTISIIGQPVTAKFIWLVVAMSIIASLQAQSKYHLQIRTPAQDSAFIQKNLDFKTTFPDSLQLVQELENIVKQLRAKTYLEASFDSLRWHDSIAVAQLHIGPAYRWASLRNGNVDEAFLNQGGFRQRLYNGKPFSYAEILKAQERILAQAENRGFPFASVFPDSIRIEEGSVEARLFMDKGRLVFFDSLNVAGDVKISESYLRNYLGIKKGDPFSRRQVLKIKDRLRELPFVREKENVTIGFWEDQASVQLSLEKKRASRFDFLLGLLPDSRREGQKLLLTGTFNAEMQNQFGRGERILVAFERLRPQTQKLELAFAYPYVLDLPFGVDLKFNQYKRDSTYTDITGDFGVQYLFQGGNYLKAFWQTTASNLITVDTAALRQGKFPDHLDVKNTAFGLEGSWQRLDYRYNPRRGWSALLRASAGYRQVRRNQAILEVAENFYDTLPGKTFRFVLDGKIERYLPIMQRSAIKLAAYSGVLFSEEPVYQNEQYRIGGSRLLRGFDEESIFATFYTVFTLEYRLLVGQNSYFYLFNDWAYLEDRRFNQPTRYDRPLSFGAGMTFETSAGVFGVGVAVGKTEGAPADFRNPKVHFGYVSLF